MLMMVMPVTMLMMMVVARILSVRFLPICERDAVPVEQPLQTHI
jgi:hypothetical protein